MSTLSLLLKTLSRPSAHAALIAYIASVSTAESDIYTDAEKVAKVIEAIREFNELFPNAAVELMLEVYDARDRDDGADGG